MDGLLLIDKPGGVTSHDVVAWARRALGQRDCGHAGTLDPMATGLLVVLAGEATKLSEYVTGVDKTYVATVRFGIETDTLDLDGVVVRTREALPPSEGDVSRVLHSMLGETLQVPPSVSAIKQQGVAAYKRVRRGESFTLTGRPVVLRAAALRRCAGTDVDVELTCSKGFYVRAFARDLAEQLGTVASLAALRRTRAGEFSVSESLAGETLRRAGVSRDEKCIADVLRAMRSIADAARVLPGAAVSDEIAESLWSGRVVSTAEFPGIGSGPCFVTRARDGACVCIGHVTDGLVRSARGFRRLVDAGA